MNIYLITDEEFFCVDGEAVGNKLSPSLAKRLCKQYNKQFSGRTQKSPTTPKKLLGDVDTRLQCIVGYFLSEEHFLSEESLEGLSMEDAIKRLNKYARTV